MLRRMRTALGLLLILALTGSPAHAQWGYGGWGWGGWGGQTPQSAALRGAGYYAMGAGVYNLDTAMANSINADTAMKWNDYVATVTHESARLHAARVHQGFLKDQAAYDRHQQQLRTNPSQHDIENGDALNAAVADLSDPRLSSSSMRAADAQVPASLIAEVPFENASERVTIMLDDLRAAFKWPDVFEGDRFANDKKLFDDIVARMRKEDQEGDISPRTLQEAKALVSDLRAKVTAQPLPDPDDQREATKFINACTTLVRLLEKPDTRAALADLRKVKNTGIGNLLGFMHAYNLRFAPATTARERQAYHQLYAILGQTRDQILSEAKLEPRATARAPRRSPTDVLPGFDGQPQPPPPQNPR